MKCVLGGKNPAADDSLIGWVYLPATTAHRRGSWCSRLTNNDLKKQNKKNKAKNLMTFMDFSPCCRTQSAWFIVRNKYKEEACRRDAGWEEEPAGAAAGLERELSCREWWGRGGRGGIELGRWRFLPPRPSLLLSSQHRSLSQVSGHWVNYCSLSLGGR